MRCAFQQAFNDGFNRVVIIGCDCPALDDALLADAFKALHNSHVVIGPATDGGYYLIGLRKFVPQLFTNVKWGTETVFTQTLERATALGLRPVILTSLSDIDRPEDVSQLDGWPWQSRPVKALSAIIVALNEQAHIEASVRSARQGAAEVLAADGGSKDKTAQYAQQAGATVITIPYGRAAQLNIAARKAVGDVLLFVHADTRLPAGFADAITAALDDPSVVGGAFGLGIDAEGRGFRWVERVTNLRSRFFKLPYGDQGLFVRREVFDKMGGFSRLAIMEDYEWVRRLRHFGRMAALPHAVRTSPRRWNKLGVMKTTWVNQLMIAGFAMGVSTDRLAAFYRNRK